MTVDFRNSVECFSKFQRRWYQEDGFRMFQKFAGFSRWEGNSEDHGRQKRWVKEHKGLLNDPGVSGTDLLHAQSLPTITI